MNDRPKDFLHTIDGISTWVGKAGVLADQSR